MKTIAVIPAHNEAGHLGDILAKVRQYVDSVIVVDDGSSDSTSNIVESFRGNVVVLRHDINLGKGAALKTGCEAACQLGADIIITLDADNQHQPDSIPLFLSALQKQPVDIVFGVRQFDRHMPLMMFIGNRLLSMMINKLFNIMVHDTQSGFRAFTKQAYEKIKWESSGYEAETEMIVRASEHELKYAEIDIDTIYHDQYKGTTALDGIRIFWEILKWRFI